MMMRLVALVVVLQLLAVTVSANQCGQMKCPVCKNEPNPKDCPSGCVTKDICGCCNVCAKAENESCRGQNNAYGFCADGLYCERESPIATGTCKSK